MTDAFDPFAAFLEKFRVRDLEIAVSDHWTWSLRPDQPTPGAGILSLNRYCEAFHEVTPEEMADLSTIVSTIETRLGGTLAPDKMNYLMLMMVDPPVHFHVLPRYSRPVEAADRVWNDLGWPGPPQLTATTDSVSAPVDDRVRHTLRDVLR